MSNRLQLPILIKKQKFKRWLIIGWKPTVRVKTDTV